MNRTQIQAHGGHPPHEAYFESLVGAKPAPHQLACLRALAEGRPVLLRAPTGSGKSEAVWIPFLQNRHSKLPARMIHVLPMRALVNQLSERMRVYAQKAAPDVRVAAMHGRRAESVLFYADALFTTLDQIVTAYACAPLSLTIRHGNIPGGAIPGSFLVFDEVHTFEPDLGLQATLVLAQRASQLGVPFALISATLPTGWLQNVASRFSAEVIEPAEEHLSWRTRRRVEIGLLPETLNVELVLGHAAHHRKTIVVLNTVRRAIELYAQLLGKFQGTTILAHSRFYEDDRDRKERQIVQAFGKEASSQPAILVATQVVEVGLDISCDLLLTELAPADALVQRAGRCARWGGEGRVIVACNLETCRPYEAQYLERTQEVLHELITDGRVLDWRLEREIVDRVLGPRFEGLADLEASAKVLATLAEASFTGSPAKAEEAVREAVPVEVALHDDPSKLGQAVLNLPRCRTHPATLRAAIQKNQSGLWRVTFENKAAEVYETRIRTEPVHLPCRLVPGAFYIIHPDNANYDPELGLRFDDRGQPARPLPRESRRKPQEDDSCRLETWRRHVDGIVRCFQELVLPREAFGLRALADRLEMSCEELTQWATLVLILHDLGKLTRQWQEAIRKSLDPLSAKGVFLARRGGRLGALPPHATVSAWVASPCLLRLAGAAREGTLAKPSLTAIAHHHAVRADETPEFEMADGWFELVEQTVREYTGYRVTQRDFNVQPPSGSGSLNLSLPFSSALPYAVYLILSRCLRLADWMASGGGEDAVLRFEEWFRDS